MLEMLSEKNANRGDGFYVRDDCAAYSAWKTIVVFSTEQPGHSEHNVKRNTKTRSGKP